ncbi:MAG: cache domain-containing protein, partial [Rhodospirillales bacterium]|nr:cache domain-containing protein [Rhodospirillales bacterium]
MTARSREFSLKTLLLLALLAVSLPPAVLAGSVVFKLAASQEATLEAGVRQRVDAIATATDRYFDSVASVLQAVSMSISLQRGDLGAFRTTAQALVHTDALAGGLALLSTTGSVLLEAPGSASTDGLEADARDAVGEVVRTGQPAVSNLYASHDLRNAAVAVAAPVFRNGALAYVLLTLVPAAELDALLRGQHLPSDWIAALVDQNGTIVARTR